LPKEEYLALVLPRTDELKRILEAIETDLPSLVRNRISEESFASQNANGLNRINTIYTELTDLGRAPFECNEVDIKLQSFVASMDNIALHFSGRGLSTWDQVTRYWLASKQAEDARKTLNHLEYEISKVR
jgi:hypothetical protein